MNQPQLGLKVAEVRQQKGFTQQQLAEYCEVSTRTIQRIESGEVEPRAFTRNSLSNTLDFNFNENDVHNENFWLAILHMSNMFTIVIIPLLIWSWKKTNSYQIDRHGRAVLNFQITMLLVFFAVLLLLFGGPLVLWMLSMPGGQPNLGLLGFWQLGSMLLLIAVELFCVYQGGRNAIRVLSDKPCHYPLSISFIK